MAQGIGPLVFPARLAANDARWTAAQQAQMKAVCVHTMQQQVHLQHILSQAWTALMNAGIQPVLMKGAGLAAYYPSPEQRPWGDIDLYVGKEQYHPACAVMRDTFPGALKFDEELDHYKHYNLIADGVSIEIHRVTVGHQHPVDEMRYEKMEHFGVQNACSLEVGGLRLKVFEPTFNALFVFLHSWEHMLTKGAILRQLVDLSFLLQHTHDAIDSKRLQQWLDELHLMDVWQLYMYILVHTLELPQTFAFFYTDAVAARAQRLLQDLLAGAMMEPEHVSSAPTNRIARKMHTMQERMRNADRIEQYSPSYARHMRATTWLHGARRFFAKDRHWE